MYVEPKKKGEMKDDYHEGMESGSSGSVGYVSG